MRRSDPIQGILFNVSDVTSVHLHAKAMERANTKQGSKKTEQTKFFLTAPALKTDVKRISRRAKAAATFEPITTKASGPIVLYNKLRKR